MTYLLDVNVLIALFDPAHPHHIVSHQWFASHGIKSWATCPMTECGFVRVVSNPAYKTVSATPEEAADRLRVFCQRPGHVFWPDSVSLSNASVFDLSHVKGHQQITDVYLAGLANYSGGKLATFDANILLAAVVGAKPDCVEVISVP